MMCVCLCVKRYFACLYFAFKTKLFLKMSRLLGMWHFVDLRVVRGVPENFSVFIVFHCLTDEVEGTTAVQNVRKFLNQWHIILSQKTWILNSSTTRRTSLLSVLSFVIFLPVVRWSTVQSIFLDYQLPV